MIYACVCRNLSVQPNFMLIHLLFIIFICITYIQISAKNVGSFNIALLSGRKRILLVANKIIKLSKNQWNTRKTTTRMRACVRVWKIINWHTQKMRSARGRVLQLRLYLSTSRYARMESHFFRCCCYFVVVFRFASLSWRIVSPIFAKWQWKNLKK